VGVLTTDPGRYLKTTAWLSEIAPVWTVHRDPAGPTLHVLFEGGLDAGFAFLPASVFQWVTRLGPVLKRVPLPAAVGRRMEEASDYYRLGYRVLFDKDGTAQRFFSLFPAVQRVRERPTARDFTECTNHFWFVAAWTAKHLRRGELWRARAIGAEGEMSGQTLGSGMRCPPASEATAMQQTHSRR
jgi:hypothetical protein